MKESSPLLNAICLIAFGILIGLALSEIYEVDGSEPEVREITSRGAKNG